MHQRRYDTRATFYPRELTIHLYIILSFIQHSLVDTFLLQSQLRHDTGPAANEVHDTYAIHGHVLLRDNLDGLLGDESTEERGGIWKISRRCSRSVMQRN